MFLNFFPMFSHFFGKFSAPLRKGSKRSGTNVANLSNITHKIGFSTLGSVAVSFFFLTACNTAGSLVDNPAQVNKKLAAKYASGSTRITPEVVKARGAQIRAQKKLISFDLDGTITQHKTPITPQNRAVLDKLSKRYRLVMVGGGGCERIYHQMGDYPIDILGNYSMQESHIVNGRFQIVRDEKVKVDTAFFNKKCDYLRKKYGYTHYYGKSVEFHESGMVTFGLLGTKAPAAEKLNFDTDKSKRRAMLPEVKKIFKNYAVFIGGTTSFDFAEKQYNKYTAVMKYAREHGYTKDQILFVGDDLGDGGNDSQMRLGGMDYIQVDDYTKLPELLEFLY